MSKFGFSDGLGQVLVIQPQKHVPLTREHMNFMRFSDILGWAWPEWVERSKLGFSVGLGQVLHSKPPKHVPPTPEQKSHTKIKETPSL